MQVNQGFDRLRQYVRLPGLSKKKLSKVDTLRAAVVYIKHLKSLLAQTDAPHHITEQFQPCPPQPQYQQQQQPAAAVDDVSGIVFLPLLQTGVNSPTASYDVTATTSGLLEPALCATYSTETACVPPTDVNDNYVATDPWPLWSQDAAAVEQQRRLSELKAWLMQ